jgi:hypothetical protein
LCGPPYVLVHPCEMDGCPCVVRVTVALVRSPVYAGASLWDGRLSLCYPCYCGSCAVPCICWCIPVRWTVVPVLAVLLWLLCGPLCVLVRPCVMGRCPCVIRVTVALVRSPVCAGASLCDGRLSLCYPGSSVFPFMWRCIPRCWAVERVMLCSCDLYTHRDTEWQPRSDILIWSPCMFIFPYNLTLYKLRMSQFLVTVIRSNAGRGKTDALFRSRDLVNRHPYSLASVVVVGMTTESSDAEESLFWTKWPWTELIRRSCSLLGHLHAVHEFPWRLPLFLAITTQGYILLGVIHKRSV